MEHKITIGKQLKMLALPFYYLAFILIGAYFLNTPDFSGEANKFIYVVCILIASSTLYIHITYYLEDRGKTFQTSNDQIIITGRGETLSYPFSALESITIVGSKNIEKFGIPQLPIELYFYAMLLFDDGKKVYITSLMIADYDKMRTAFQDRYVSRHYGLYNLLPDS